MKWRSAAANAGGGQSRSARSRTAVLAATRRRMRDFHMCHEPREIQSLNPSEQPRPMTKNRSEDSIRKSDSGERAVLPAARFAGIRTRRYNEEMAFPFRSCVQPSSKSGNRNDSLSLVDDNSNNDMISAHGNSGIRPPRRKNSPEAERSPQLATSQAGQLSGFWRIEQSLKSPLF
jgi:hypothetical protein